MAADVGTCDPKPDGARPLELQGIKISSERMVSSEFNNGEMSGQTKSRNMREMGMYQDLQALLHLDHVWAAQAQPLGQLQLPHSLTTVPDEPSLTE